jgi:hypothetical protein
MALLVVSTGCTDSAAERFDAWPDYTSGYSAGTEYKGKANQTRDYCRNLAADNYGDADSPQGIVFVYGCGQGANGLPMDTEEAIGTQYGDLQQDD